MRTPLSNPSMKASRFSKNMFYVILFNLHFGIAFPFLLFKRNIIKPAPMALGSLLKYGPHKSPSFQIYFIDFLHILKMANVSKSCPLVQNFNLKFAQQYILIVGKTYSKQSTVKRFHLIRLVRLIMALVPFLALQAPEV